MTYIVASTFRSRKEHAGAISVCHHQMPFLSLCKGVCGKSALIHPQIWYFRLTDAVENLRMRTNRLCNATGELSKDGKRTVKPFRWIPLKDKKVPNFPDNNKHKDSDKLPAGGCVRSLQ
jgi:hypothetical protein